MVTPQLSSFLAATTGVAVALPIGLLFIMTFVSPYEPPCNFLNPILFSGVIGFFTGIGSVVIQRSKTSQNSVRIYLADLILIAVPISILCGWYAHEIESDKLFLRISAAGGSVTWNATDDLKGRWEICFRGSEMNDTDLADIVSDLRHFSRIELDLGYTSVTEHGIDTLVGLPNLVKLRIDNTSITAPQIVVIRSKLPGTDVVNTWP